MFEKNPYKESDRMKLNEIELGLRAPDGSRNFPDKESDAKPENAGSNGFLLVLFIVVVILLISQGQF